MRKLIAFNCLLAGSACLGVGGMLLVAGILPAEGIFCILLGISWLTLAEAILDQNILATPKQLIFNVIHHI